MRIFSRLVILGLCLSSIACSSVKPWERGNLARAEMSFTPDPLERKIKDHIYHSKEAASSVTAGSGGGCGCN
jgi:hypothetical protein